MLFFKIQVNRETETSTLFRAASLPTTLMDLYMRAECGGFLQAAVLETVLRLLESKQSAELNPAKMDSPDDACSNAEFLLQILDQVSYKSTFLILDLKFLIYTYAYNYIPTVN